MKLISMKRPITASMAASATTGSPRLNTGWKKPRPCFFSSGEESLGERGDEGDFDKETDNRLCSSNERYG